MVSAVEYTYNLIENNKAIAQYKVSYRVSSNNKIYYVEKV